MANSLDSDKDKKAQNYYDRMANSVVSDQTVLKEHVDLGLHYLFRPVRPNTVDSHCLDPAYLE